MTRSASDQVATALRGRLVEPRDFIWFAVKDRDTGAPVYDGYWSDVGTTIADVIDPATGGISTRQFFGSGTLIKISDIELVSGLTVQTVTVTLSQCADRVNDLVRSYQCKQGRIEIFRGLYDPVSKVLIDAAIPRFVGFIDNLPIKTGEEGGEGGIELTATSHTQELTRSNSDTRSDASQRLRNAADAFYQDTATVGDWEYMWGRASGAVASNDIKASAK